MDILSINGIITPGTYYDYLNRKPSWSLTAVQDIDSSTDEIMNALANPRSGRACDRMGMVFGYVQSGKTAHYIGLINKAVDSGYRIVVGKPLDYRLSRIVLCSADQRISNISK